LDSVLRDVVEALSLPEEEVLGEIERAGSRLRDRRDRRELLELENLLRDAQESGADESALLARVESLRMSILERQRQWQERSEWAHRGAT